MQKYNQIGNNNLFYRKRYSFMQNNKKGVFFNNLNFKKSCEGFFSYHHKWEKIMSLISILFKLFF